MTAPGDGDGESVFDAGDAGDAGAAALGVAGATAFGVTALGASAFGASAFGVIAFGASPFGAGVLVVVGDEVEPLRGGATVAAPAPVGTGAVAGPGS